MDRKMKTKGNSGERNSIVTIGIASHESCLGASSGGIRCVSPQTGVGTASSLSLTLRDFEIHDNVWQAPRRTERIWECPDISHEERISGEAHRIADLSATFGAN